MAEGDNAQNWESDAEERVWYVAYGSNIDKERFKEHIKTEIMPESRAYELPFDLYFAAKAPKRKNGGVAFVATERGTEKTLGRMYLLTLRQFTQVAKGENNNLEVNISKEMLSEKKPVDIREGLDELAKQEGMYRVLLPCGEYEGVPIVTLTGWRDKILKRDRARPSEDYLNKIRDGLHDTYRSLTDSKINEYLKAAIDRYPQPSAKSDGTELVESGASAKSITVQEEPPFTVKSMVEYCWGMTLNLSHVPQQNILGKEFNTEFFKRLEKSNSKFSNDFILRLAQTIRTMAFARDAHVRVLNSNAKALSEKKNFWADITQLASFSKEGVPMQVLSFLGAGSFAQVYKFISSNGNTTPVSLPIFLLAGAIGVVAVTIILKIIGTVYMSLQERRIEKNQAIYYRQEFKRQMAISLLNFYRDVKELVKAHYPKYIQGPMYDSDIMSSTDEEVRILISNRILPPDKLNWTVWEETKTD